jgi:hypothetical protein
MISIQSTIDLRLLRIRQTHLVWHLYDGIPDIFNKLDSLRDTQAEDARRGQRAHGYLNTIEPASIQRPFAEREQAQPWLPAARLRISRTVLIIKKVNIQRVAVGCSAWLDGTASLASKYPYKKNSNHADNNVRSEDAELVEKCRRLSKWIVLICRLRAGRIDERVNRKQNSESAEQDQR